MERTPVIIVGARPTKRMNTVLRAFYDAHRKPR